MGEQTTRVRIVVTDGTTDTARIEDAESGKRIEGVTRVEIEPLVRNAGVVATLRIERVELDIVADVGGES